MTVAQGFQIAGGILAALGILVAGIVMEMPLERALPGGWIFGIPFVLLAAVGVVAWFKRRKRPSAFLNGLLIGVCISMLLCAACDARLFGFART